MTMPTIADVQAQVAAVNAATQQLLGMVFSLNQNLAALSAPQPAPVPLSPKPGLLSFNTAAHSQYLAVV